MSTTNPNDLARKLIDRLSTLKSQYAATATEAEELVDATALVRQQLRRIRPDCDEITQGLIDSALNPLMSQDISSMSQGLDPK